MSALLAQLLDRHRTSLLVLLVGVTAVAASIAWRLEFDFTPRVMFAGHGDMLDFSEEFKQRFGYEDALLLVVVEATGSADVLDAECLNWQIAAVRRLEQVGHVDQVVAPASLKLPRVRVLGRQRVVSVPLIDHWPADSDAALRARRVLDHYAFVDQTLLSRDRKTGVMVCFIKPEARDIALLRAVVTQLRHAALEVPPPAGYRLHFQGLPALRTQIVDDLMTDQARLLPLVAVWFLGLLYWIYRSWVAALLPLAAAGTGLVWTVAVLVATGQSLNIISNVLPVLLFIIGVSNCVHVVGRYGEICQAEPGDSRSAAKATIASMAGPCLLTYLTTAIGFGSLVWARSHGLQAFGWQAALGMGLMYVSTLWVLGLLLPLYRSPRLERAAFRATTRVTTRIAQATRQPTRYVTICFGVTAGLCVAAIVLGVGVPVNSRLVETYSDDHPTVQSMHLVDRELGGFVPLEVSLTADRPGRFTQLDILRRIIAFEQFARQCDDVLFVRSYADLLAAVHAQSRPSAEPLDDPAVDHQAGAARVVRANRLAESMAETLGYRAFLDARGTHARVLLRMRDAGTRKTLLLAAQLEAELARLFPPGQAIGYRLTGDAYLNAHAMDGFVRDMLASLVGASVVVFGVIGLLFRSLRLGLIAVIPNLTPLILTLGYLGLRGYELNVANVVVFAIGLGVAVDDTIHFLSRFLEELPRTGDVGSAIRHVLVSAGRTMTFTTVVIVSGLALMLVSEFLPTRRFAELTAVTMLSALAGDLVLLPACLLALFPAVAPLENPPGN